MIRPKNIFLGDNYESLYAICIYDALMSRDWVNSRDFIARYEQKTPDEISKISSTESESSFKKAVQNVLKALKIYADEDEVIIEKRGKSRNLEYRYVGKDNDPLAFMKTAVVKKNLEDYYQFCQDSAGFFPSSWIEHFFSRTIDLLNINQKKKQRRLLIGTSFDNYQNNLELLPFVYECIRDEQVLRITYNAHFQERITVVFHPHYLKEYNSRWHILGYAEGEKEGFDIPLDRIVVTPIILGDVSYIPSKQIKYPDFFHDIVGTTHLDGVKRYDIIIRVYGEYMFGLMETRPMHISQKTNIPYSEELGYGELCLNVSPNNEFYGTILKYGAALEIISPDEVRTEIGKRISEMQDRYKK